MEKKKKTTLCYLKKRKIQALTEARNAEHIRKKDSLSRRVYVRLPISLSEFFIKYSLLWRIWSIFAVCDGSPAAPFRFATSTGSSRPGGNSSGGW